MVLFNPYVSSNTLTTNESFSIYTTIYTAMKEGFNNIYKAFQSTDKPINPNIENTYVPSNFSKRAVHFLIGVALCFPGVGNVTLVVMRRLFTLTIPAQEMPLEKAHPVISACLKKLRMANPEKDLNGIFRVPGFESHLLRMNTFVQTKHDLHESDVETFFTTNDFTYHDIGKFMTRVLNSKTTTFLTTEEFNEFNAADINDKNSLVIIFNKLSVLKKDIFIKILSYLKELLIHKEFTQMTQANLCMIWGATLFKSNENSIEFGIINIQKAYALCSAFVDLIPELSKDSSSKMTELSENLSSASDVNTESLADPSSNDFTEDPLDSGMPLESTEKTSRVQKRSKSLEKKTELLPSGESRKKQSL